MRNARLDQSQAGIKIAGRNINNLRHAGDTTNCRNRGTKKSLLIRVKESEKSWLKTQHSKKNYGHGIRFCHFMVNRRGEHGRSDRFYFRGLHVKLKDTCSLEGYLWQTCESDSCSFVSYCLWPRGLYSPWNSPGQNTGVGRFSLLRGSSQPRDRTQVSHIVGTCFTSWATKEAQEYWSG